MNWITIGGIHYNMDRAISIEPTKGDDYTGYKIDFGNMWVSIGIPFSGSGQSEDACSYMKIKHLLRNAGTYPEKS